MASWLGLLSQTLEASVVVFLRTNVGERFLGLQAGAVIPLVLVYSVFWEGHDVRPLFAFLGCYLLACLSLRFRGIWHRRRGEIVHSQYSGTPLLMRAPLLRRWLSERATKSTVEPLLVLLLGYLLLSASAPLGSYLMLAAGGQFVSFQLALAYERQRLMDARDAYIEQRHMAERFRQGG
ncbi:MAG: hypothetical protein KC492_02370 [Myxococcales bacterium]|nr:hypothetical protein [Myxococcales bacterium]